MFVCFLIVGGRLVADQATWVCLFVFLLGLIVRSLLVADQATWVCLFVFLLVGRRLAVDPFVNCGKLICLRPKVSRIFSRRSGASPIRGPRTRR